MKPDMKIKSCSSRSIPSRLVVNWYQLVTCVDMYFLMCRSQSRNVLCPWSLRYSSAPEVVVHWYRKLAAADAPASLGIHSQHVLLSSNALN